MDKFMAIFVAFLAASIGVAWVATIAPIVGLLFLGLIALGILVVLVWTTLEIRASRGLTWRERTRGCYIKHYSRHGTHLKEVRTSGGNLVRFIQAPTQ
jgi:hypothetical protein